MLILVLGSFKFHAFLAAALALAASPSFLSAAFCFSVRGFFALGAAAAAFFCAAIITAPCFNNRFVLA